MNEFSKRLYFYMKKANITQAELCKITGIGKSSISEYLSGNYEPKQRNIYKIATALNIKPSELLGITEENIDSSTLSADEVNLIKKYRQLDADGQAEIDGLMDLKLKLQNAKSKDIHGKAI